MQTLGKADVAHAGGESSANWLQWEEVGSLILDIRDYALKPSMPDEIPEIISLLYLVIQK